MMNNIKLSTLLREPLLHFLFIGAALFFLYNVHNETTVDNNRIVISKAQINHLLTLWKKKRQREPTQAELDSMIQQQVREEVMVREALAMGLDNDDRIIRRRLAQKMEFITSNIATLAEPDDTELRDYLLKHSDKFSLPARIDFKQVFINPEKHGIDTDDYAKNLLSKLLQDGKEIDIKTISDSLMLETHYNQVTVNDATRLFGKDFSSEIFTLPVGSWQGPIQSGYGYHLVHISQKTEEQMPELDTIREKVLLEWQSQQRRELDIAFYENLRKRYEITIEE